MTTQGKRYSKVFVLGAGASHALNSGAPFMWQLLPLALKFSSDPREGTVSKRKADAVIKFMSEFYHSEINEALPPFEDVLSQLDYCIINNVPLSRKYTAENLRQLRKDLIYIMGRVIQVKTRNRTETSLVGSFIGNLQPDDSIVSLNYDLIVDNAQQHAGTGIVNYGVQTSQPKMEHKLVTFHCPSKPYLNCMVR